MKHANLTKEELSEVKGGNQASLISSENEIKNVNDVARCVCDYVNRQSIINKNKQHACTCVCI